METMWWREVLTRVQPAAPPAAPASYYALFTQQLLSSGLCSCRPRSEYHTCMESHGYIVGIFSKACLEHRASRAVLECSLLLGCETFVCAARTDQQTVETCSFRSVATRSPGPSPLDSAWFVCSSAQWELASSPPGCWWHRPLTYTSSDPPSGLPQPPAAVSPCPVQEE